MKKPVRYLFIVCAIIFYSIDIVSAQYCTPTYTNLPSVRSTFIQRVRLQGIDNSNSSTLISYNDYTNNGSRAVLNRGLVYSLIINAGSCPSYYTSLRFAAWIDYNADEDFSDAGEKLGQVVTATLDEQISINFTVPADMRLNTFTRMRIRCMQSTTNISMDPCVNYSYGEAEDYSIIGISGFQQVLTGITGISAGEIAFFNKNTDNDYDLIMHKEYTFNPHVPITFYDNISETFNLTDYINGDLPELENDNLTFNLCDLNNDNQIDIMFNYRHTSNLPRTVYFQRTGTQLSLVSTGIIDLYRGNSAAADFNNDGRQDIIVCGIGSDQDKYTYMYMNTPTGFVLVNDDFKGVYGQVLAADYDNDRDVDILLTGNDRYGNTNAIIYRNDNNWKFTDIRANLNKIGWGTRSAFGDFNNDGKLDLIIGNIIYRNDGNDTFTELKAVGGSGLYDEGHWKDIDNDGEIELIGQEDWGLTIYEFNGVDSFLLDQQLYVSGDNFDIGDFNNDKKQDIIINSSPQASIMKNLTAAINEAPTVPIKLASLVNDSGFFSVSLKWAAGDDNKTPINALTYNLRVGTTPGGNEIMSSMTSPADGSLLKPGMGNVFNNKSWYLKNLAPGKYYWSVQTVDNSGLTSPFAAEKTFLILSPLTNSTFTVNGYSNFAGPGADFDSDRDMDLLIYDTLLQIYEQTLPYIYTRHDILDNSMLLDMKDINNDNLVDIIARHKRTSAAKDSLAILINKGNYQFQVVNIDTLMIYTVASADFDNDGDIDLLTHVNGFYLYENTGSLQFLRKKLSITETMEWASLSAIDIDCDNDIDFIISGKKSLSFTETKCYTLIYKNEGEFNFTLAQTILPGVGPSSFQIATSRIATNPADISFNDINMDGFPDLMISGDDEYRNTTNQIFLNDGTGKMTLSSLSPRPADKYSSTLLDFNTDGYLDIIMPRVAFDVDYTIYFNNENSSFTGFSNAADSLENALYINPVDADQDKDKDLLLTYKVPISLSNFRYETKILINTNNFINQAPTAPASTSSEIDSFTVILNWNKGWDKLTGNEGLSYNIWVGTVNNKADVVSPMADMTTGYRYVEALGNVGTNTTWKLENLPLGTYYWSVQAIDNSMTPSAWAPVKSFTLSALTADFSNNEVCYGFDTQLTDNSVTTHPITSWKWIIGGKTVSTAQNPVYRFTTPGNNSVKLVVESSVAKDSITKNVFVKPVPDAAFTNNTVCAGTSTTFTNTTTTNGLTISEWHWDFGDNSGSNVQNPGLHGYLVAGTYDAILVTVADNGCSDTIRKAVDVGVIPTAAITLTGLPNFCSDDSVKLVNSYTETYTYSWQNGGADITGAVTNSYTARLTGSYTVKVTNPVGNCTSVSPAVNITVKESPLRPAIAFNGDTVFCAGDNLILSAPYDNDLIYKWKLNGGSVGRDTSMHAAETGGEYTLVVTNSQGCSSLSVNKVEIKVNPRPAAATLSPPSKPQICQGEDIVLGVTSFPAYSYQWLNENNPVPGAVSNTFRVTATGKYQLEISNATGCSIRTNIVDIVVNASPVKPLIDTSNYDKNMCVGESPLKISIYNPIENYSYTWYKNGAPTSTMTYIEDFLEDGTYYVEADLNGCKSTSEIITLDFKEAMPKPLIEAKGPVVWYLTTSSKAEYYKWYFNGNLVTDAITSTYLAGQKLGIYRVSISNDGKCFRISDAVTIPFTPGLTGIEDSNPFEGVKIYPNPTTGMFTIEMNNNVFGEFVIDIITQNGSKILNIKFDKTTEYFSSQIDLSGQSKGMYLINLSLDKFKAVRKVVVE